MDLSVSNALRTELLLETPGLPFTQSPAETVWSAGLLGLIYVLLFPGGVRLSTNDGSLGFPLHASQPKFPACVPLRISLTLSPI